jgi:hypothetical protein
MADALYIEALLLEYNGLLDPDRVPHTIAVTQMCYSNFTDIQPLSRTSMNNGIYLKAVAIML